MANRLDVDLTVRAALAEALDYWQAIDDEATGRLYQAFRDAIWRVEHTPEHGLHVSGLPANYRRMRLPGHLPGYILTYRIDPSRTLLFLMRHERQRPYTPATIQRKASEAARRADQPEIP